MAYSGSVRLTSDGQRIGITCPDCQMFVGLVVTLTLGEPVEMQDWATGRPRHYEAPLIVNKVALASQFEDHVRRDPAMHPSFATPVDDRPIG